MAKFRGVVGYGHQSEIPPGSGVWKDQIVEYEYYGDVRRNTRRLQDGEYLNNDLTVSNSISIVADPYAREHFFNIRYVMWAGTRWTVTEVEADVNGPRLLLRLGGVYNGQTPDGTP